MKNYEIYGYFLGSCVYWLACYHPFFKFITFNICYIYKDMLA